MISKGSGHSHLPTQLFQGKTIFPSRSTLHTQKKTSKFHWVRDTTHSHETEYKTSSWEKEGSSEKTNNFISGYIYIQSIE